MVTDKEIVGYSILTGFIFYIVGFGIFGDQIANFAYAQGSLVSLILYYLTQTQFIVILIGTVYIGFLKERVLGGIGAGILIDLATDMNSSPRCVLQSGFISNAPNLALCSDTVYIRWLDYIFPHVVSYHLYYWVLPVIFVIIAFEFLGVTNFIKYFTKQASS